VPLAAVVGFSCSVVMVLLAFYRAWVGSVSAFAVSGVDFGDGGGERLSSSARGKNPPGRLPGGG
jgi:hypothetical protein